MTDSDSTTYDEAHTPGMPPGITVEGSEMRSRIATAMTRNSFPATRQELVLQAEASNAGGDVVSALRRLPGSGTYASVAEVAIALGLGHEERPGGSRA